MDDQTIVKEITDIRVKNNSPWMGLLLLALELDRERAIVFLRQILVNDAGVNKLLMRLVEAEGGEVDEDYDPELDDWIEEG